MAEHQFIKLCENGHLDRAKQLLEINPTINISAGNVLELKKNDGKKEIHGLVSIR